MDWMFCKLGDLPEEEYLAIYEGLSPSRKAHIDRKRREEDKKRSLLAAKLVASLLEKRGISGVSLEVAPDGKPYLEGSGLFVSITHSDQLVACALSEEPVGIDAERIRPLRVGLVRYACLPEEWQYISQGEIFDVFLEEENAMRRFFEVWTAKEAFYKKNGEGNMLGVNTLFLEKAQFQEEDYFITIL